MPTSYLDPFNCQVVWENCKLTSNNGIPQILDNVTKKDQSHNLALTDFKWLRNIGNLKKFFGGNYTFKFGQAVKVGKGVESGSRLRSKSSGSNGLAGLVIQCTNSACNRLVLR